MDDRDIAVIESWHAHVYFDAACRAAAWALREKIVARFGANMEMGRFHEKPVGPHPMWSYQIAFKPDRLSLILPWLALNRGDLIVFTHPNTGDALGDHRDRAIWMGALLKLELSVLS